LRGLSAEAARPSLLSTAYDTGLRASELVAVAVKHIEETIDPEERLLQILRSKGDQDVYRLAS
jgi:site-specific recombinase XerD